MKTSRSPRSASGHKRLSAISDIPVAKVRDRCWMTGHATFSSGPIGAGKTTLGRAVANRLDAAFVEGDDYADHTKPW